MAYKNRIGRIPKYETVEEMIKKIDEYFEYCNGEFIVDEDGEPMFSEKGNIMYLREPCPPTVSGLAYHLGFTTRQALLNYEGKKAFVDTITRAKLKIESYAERRLYDREGQRGAEFVLKCNYRWRDRDTDEKNENDKAVIIDDIK